MKLSDGIYKEQLEASLKGSGYPYGDASILGQYIKDKLDAHIEPESRDTSPGAINEFSKEKLLASLILALTRIPAKNVTEIINTNKVVISRWRKEELFASAMESHIDEFAHLLIDRLIPIFEYMGSVKTWDEQNIEKFRRSMKHPMRVMRINEIHDIDIYNKILIDKIARKMIDPNTFKGKTIYNPHYIYVGMFTLMSEYLFGTYVYKALLDIYKNWLIDKIESFPIKKAPSDRKWKDFRMIAKVMGYFMK